MINITLFEGKHIRPFVEDILRFRVRAFKEYPYLYEADLKHEKSYAQEYANDPQGLLAVAFEGNKVVGLSTGIPLKSASPNVAELKQMMLEKGIDFKRAYYYGEAILLPEYQGQGLTTQLYAAKEDKIKSWGYTRAYLLTVKRPPKHPLKPVNYQSPDALWKHLGFKKLPQFKISFRWNMVVDKATTCREIENDMELWQKVFKK